MSSRPAPVTRKTVKSEYIETVGLCPFLYFFYHHHPLSHMCGRKNGVRHENFLSLHYQSPASTIDRSDNDDQDTGNKISRKAKIEGKPNIMLGGRTVIMADVYMRGDLHRFSSSSGEGGQGAQPTTAISIGRFVHPSIFATPASSSLCQEHDCHGLD